MKSYNAENLRNIGLLAHKGAGKTSLGEAMLFSAKATTRQGRVEEGNTIFDYDVEEINRVMSINASIAWLEWKKHKINIVDTPGDINFLADTINSIQIIDSAVLVVSAVDGVEIQTYKRWQNVSDRSLPCIAFINKMDRERADFEKTVADLSENLSAHFTPLQLPIGQEANFNGIVDLLQMKSYVYENDGTGEFKEGEVPADLMDEVESAREKLIENIAETDDELLEKYLEEGELNEDEILEGLKKAVKKRQIFPILCGSASKNIGITPLLDLVVNYFPSTLETGSITAIDCKSEEEIERKISPDEPFAALVFKTIVDPYAGKLSVFKILSGILNPDSVVYNSKKQCKERFGQILQLFGKKPEAVQASVPGDILAVAKLKETITGDTLCDDSHQVLYSLPSSPPPAISFAIKPKSKGDEDKIANAVNRLKEEDPTLVVTRDEQFKDLILSGMGQNHIEVIVDKMKRKFGVEVTLALPKVPYRETVKKKVTNIEGKHKKQTGGRGQFGVCYIDLEPLPYDAEEPFEFVDNIVGGSIPRQYIPAVEKGIIGAMEKGVLGGFPMENIRVRLFDGKYHDVDSSEMAFKVAGSKGFKLAAKEAKPTLLEPVMTMEVTVPEEFMGDIIGDLNSRRGKVLGMDTQGKNQIIKAQVPMAEVLKYSPDLTSMTSGQGIFTMQHSHYEEVPAQLQEKIIKESKVDDEDDDD